MPRKSKLRRFLLDFDFFSSSVRLDFGGILVCAYEFWVWSTMDVSVRASPSTQGHSVTQGHSGTPLPSSFKVPRQLRAHKMINPNDQRLSSNPSGKVTRESPACRLRAGLGRAGTGITVHRARCHGSARHTTAANRVSRRQGLRGCVSGQTAVARLWSAVIRCGPL